MKSNDVTRHHVVRSPCTLVGPHLGILGISVCNYVALKLCLSSSSCLNEVLLHVLSSYASFSFWHSIARTQQRETALLRCTTLNLILMNHREGVSLLHDLREFTLIRSL